MWSGGDLEGRLFGGGPPAREPARHLWGTGCLPEAAVDLSLKPVSRSCQALRRNNHQNNTSSETKRTELSEMATPSVVSEETKTVAIETEDSPAKPVATTAQIDLREFSSVKEVLLEMTNRKNGHAKLPLTRWSIIKKESDQLSMKAAKYGAEDKKGPRPTALVNPFPADVIPLNGNAQVWLQAAKQSEVAPARDGNNSCALAKVSKQPVRQKIQKNTNGKPEQSKKKPLNTIVAQLTGSLKGSNTSQSAQTDPSILHKLLAPADSISFLSSQRLTGGDVSVSEPRERGAEPDLSVVDRLKRLGTVIEIEDQSEPNSLKMLEKMTKSVSPTTAEDSSKIPHLPLPKQQQTISIPTLYISKDVTLIPKLAQDSVSSAQDKLEPSVLEPVIDIFEEENHLSQDGTFLFKTDSYHSVDLPNSQKVFSCDICSAVYSHSNMLRKHYLRLHISRKYISEKDMETFNIDPEQDIENSKEKLLFRCHTCRVCFSNKNDLRSHLTDHPPVDDLVKQNNKPHPTYKCDNCPAVFKWRKQFGKHKKACKVPVGTVLPSPTTSTPSSSDVTKPDLYHCLYCNETFLNANTKRNHILSNHPYVRRKHYCVFCKKDTFTNNINLFSHLVTEHPTVYFGCQVCKERYTNLEELKAHVSKRHEHDERLKLSVMDRTSAIEQEKEHYKCDTCQRRFLIENSFKEHVCFPEKQEKPKPKLQKIKKKVYPVSERLEKHSLRNMDMETLFYSRVASNVRDNLMNHLDGKIYKVDASDDDKGRDNEYPSNSQTRTLNFSAGFPSTSEINDDHGNSEIPARSKAQWEKYTFPKNYDGRCGLTSYIKDTSYLDISTQLIMRRNLQRLNMLPMKGTPTEDVPSVLALERLGAECAESYGQIKKDKDASEETPELGSLSGEWVRERMYVCSACRWESPCLWTMEDHKFLSHPRVHCPQHELIGEQAALSKTIYKRLSDAPTPFKGPSPSTPPPFTSITCTKCSKAGFKDRTELHVHILECAGVVLEPVGPSSSRRRRRRNRRRPRRGLKRNIPSTPQKLPSKPRTKPGDTDTIQRMIANLPPKRVSRKVFSGFEDDKSKNRNKNGNDKNRGKKKPTNGNRSQSEPPTPTKEEMSIHRVQVMLQNPTVIKKEQDYIDTSAEGGDVLSSLRMMPVRCIRPPVDLPSTTLLPENNDSSPILIPDEKEMPKLEIEKDISPVESSEIPVLSPVERKDDVKKDKEDLICGISFVDGLIKYETIASVSQETQKMEINRKRKNNTNSKNEPKKKKMKDEKPVLTRSQQKEDNNKNKKKTNKTKEKGSSGAKGERTTAVKEDSPRRRGRPKGSITRKLTSVGSRRSNRISKDNSSIKFDEILPCEEVEESVNKKAEKPQRKPRTIKKNEPNKADSTIIVVKAEVHPEPVNKRKATRDNTPEVDNSGTCKKSKGDNESKLGIQNAPEVIDVYTFVEEITEINLGKSPSKNCKFEAVPKGEATQQTDLLDQHQTKRVSSNDQEVQLVDSSIEIDSGKNDVSVDNGFLKEEVVSADLTDSNENIIVDTEPVSGSNKSITEENEVTSTSVSNFEDPLESSVQLNDEMKVKVMEEEMVDTSEVQLVMTVSETINSGNNEEVSSFNIESDSFETTDNSQVKKKKINKKSMKMKKKGSSSKMNSPSYQGDAEFKADNYVSSEDADEKLLKLKKTKKQLKKEKEIVDLPILKKPKKIIKKKKVIKKIVKLKKRRPSKCQSEVPNGSEVVSIAGFKWEVSKLESPIKVDAPPTLAPPVSLPAKTKQDSSDATESETLVQPKEEPQFNQLSQPSTSDSTIVSTSSASVANWEPQPLWESQVPDPSLGTIIDSVNKLLNEPDNTYSPLGLPSYSLADLQKAMGASDDEMAVLQQLGEASLQISSSDGSCSIGMRGDGEEWPADSKCIMDLDNQSTAAQAHGDSLQNSLQQDHTPSSNQSLKGYCADTQPKVKEEVTPNSLLAAHQGKEVLCPSCSCHFMGFPALQQHLAKAHPSVGPKAKPKRGGIAFSKIDLSRRMPLDSSQGPRLICYSCQQILPSDRMPLHLEQEHELPPDDVSKCSSLSGDTVDGPVVGERLKSKMSSALGDLLDRAVINLLTARHKPNNTLSGGAVDLFTKLCAAWKREGSVRGSVFRLPGARELISKLQIQKDGLLDDDALKVAAPFKPYSCTICGQKFSLPSSRNKHEVLAHRSFRVSNTPEPYEMEEYDNDWREAPSPPEVNGDNSGEASISPLCSDCGLSFDTIQEMMRHRLEDHSTRRSSVDTSNLSGCCPSPVPSSVGSRSLPDSEAEDSSSGIKRRKSTRATRLGANAAQQAQAVTRSVKERAEAALRELNLPRQRSTDKRWAPSCNSKQKTDVYSFTDESL